MQKTKSHSGAKKRFKITAKGRLKRRRACGSHLLEKKSSSRKRRIKREADIFKGEKKKIKKLLGK